MNFSVTAIDKIPLTYCMSLLQELIYACQFRSQRSCCDDLCHNDCIHSMLRLTSQCTPFPSLIVCGQHCISYCMFMYRFILEYSGSVKWWRMPWLKMCVSKGDLVACSPRKFELHGLTSCLGHNKPKTIDPSYHEVIVNHIIYLTVV